MWVPFVAVSIAVQGFSDPIHMLTTWTGPEWSSLHWHERGVELAARSPITATYDWVPQAWLWSELVVLRLNQKRRALHDFIAGTVVIRVRPTRAAHSPVARLGC